MNIKKLIQLAIGISLIITGLIYFTVKNPMNIGNKLPFETEVYAEKARVETLKPDKDGFIRVFFDAKSLLGGTPESYSNTFKEFKLIDDIIASEDGATYVFTPEHFEEYKKIKSADTNLLKPIEPDEDGLIRVFYDLKMLGPNKPETLYKANKIHDSVDDVIANKNGVTYVFTPKHFKEYKEIMAEISKLTEFVDVVALRKEAVYTDNLKQNVILYVDKDQFFSSDVQQIPCILGAVWYSSIYQILSGVSTYEWTTAITVVDYNTNEVLASYTFPDENRKVYINMISDSKE